jgi:hypothetical protein
VHVEIVSEASVFISVPRLSVVDTVAKYFLHIC